MKRKERRLIGFGSLEKLSLWQMAMNCEPSAAPTRQPDELDGTDKLITLPHPMQFVIRTLLVCVAAAFVFPESVAAAIVFKPGKKPDFVVPGEEEISGNAAELFQVAEAAEKEGNLKRAIKAYSSLVKRHPKDALAPGALYRKAQLQEQEHDYIRAAESFRQLVEGYPSSPHFDEAIEAQFRIGEMYLAGKKTRVLGIPFGSSMDNAVNIFAAVVRTAPYGKYTARAQFDIGLALEKQAQARRRFKPTRRWWTSSLTSRSRRMLNIR